MKLKTLATLFCLVPFFALSGPIDKEFRNYRNYHEQINEAEKLISNGYFQDALMLLEQVFNDYDFVFLRDYKIAAPLALYIDEKKKAFQYINKGIAAGWELKALENNKYLAQLQNDPAWKLIGDAYPDLRRNYLTTIDQSTRETVRQMFKKDQRKALGALLRIGNKAQERYAIKKFAPHSEIQINDLMKILESHGYPGEKLIGNNFWMSNYHQSP